MRSARIVSLFAGIGGLEEGLEAAGVGRTILQCELDAHARSVLARHRPEARRHDDVRTLRLALGDADVLCGGFPCQDVSAAGLGAGIAEGTRSGLWFEYARLVREARPEWVVVENVSALLSRGLCIVAADLTAAGYDLAWDCVPASAVGAPHRRDRVFIVAWRRDVCAPPLRVSERAFAAGIARAAAVSPQWPARPGEAQHAWEPPRVAHKVPHRAKRLKALGNAVVPQVAEAVGYALVGIRDAAFARKEAREVARFDGRAFLPPQTGLFGAEPIQKWPRAGTVRGGVAFELVPAAPIARGGEQWATPAAGLPNDGVPVESRLARRDALRAKCINGNGAGMPLGVQVRVEWPTPTVKGNHNRVGVSATSGDGLATAVLDTVPRVVQATTGETAPLSPDWVECLMGFPVGWTCADALASPDADNVLKAVADALEDVAYPHDGRVAFGTVATVWGPHAETLVRVRPLDPRDVAWAFAEAA